MYSRPFATTGIHLDPCLRPATSTALTPPPPPPPSLFPLLFGLCPTILQALLSEMVVCKRRGAVSRGGRLHTAVMRQNRGLPIPTTAAVAFTCATVAFSYRTASFRLIFLPPAFSSVSLCPHPPAPSVIQSIRLSVCLSVSIASRLSILIGQRVVSETSLCPPCLPAWQSHGSVFDQVEGRDQCSPDQFHQ